MGGSGAGYRARAWSWARNTDMQIRGAEGYGAVSIVHHDEEQGTHEAAVGEEQLQHTGTSAR
jgi:hypothetical protein